MRDDIYNSNEDPYNTSEQAEANQRRAVLLSLLRGRWHWAILLAVLLGVAGGYLGYNSQSDMYEAETFIDIKPNYSDVAISVSDLTVYEPYINFVNGEIRRLRSLDVGERAMSTSIWQENLATRSDDLPEITLDDFISSIGVSEPGKNETLLYVRFDDEDPATASAGLNAVLEAYRREQKQDQATNVGENLRLLTDREKELEAERISLEKQIKQVIPDEDVQNLRTRRSSLQNMLSRMEFVLNEIELEVKPFEDLQGNKDETTLRELMLQDPEMKQLLENKRSLEDRLVYLIEVLGRGEAMADVRQTRKSMSVVDRKIAELEAKWLESGGQQAEAQLPQSILDLKAQKQVVLEKIDELNTRINDLSFKLSSIAELERQLEDKRDSLYATRDRIDEFKRTGAILSQEEVSRIEIGPPAATPATPWNAGKRRQLAGVGAIGGMFSGFGLIMLVGLLDRRLRYVSDTSMGMEDVNVLGILPTLPNNITDPEEAESAAHCVHHIRTLLQIGGSNRVFSITSPETGSGKSSLATALGMSFSNSGARTLVIDCDLVGAGLSRRIGAVVHEPLDAVIRMHGMLDEADLSSALTKATAQNKPLDHVLLEEGLFDQEKIDAATRLQRDTALGVLQACSPGRLRSCVASSGIDNLFVLPVGKARPSDASKLSPAAVRELVRQAREAYDIVLIDTGPVLGSLEASIAAAEADATIVIVARGDHKSIATRTLAQLRSVRANIAGIVFNHALERDMLHTSYASVVSQDRRPDREVRKRRIDRTRSARLGPLGTALASYLDEDEQEAKANGKLNPTNGQHVPQEDEDK